MQFLMVYIREAHAIDSPAPLVGGKRPLVEDPMHLGERREVAHACRRALELEGLPAVVDDVDDRVAQAYDAWPSRLALVGQDGIVRYQSMRGPYGLEPDELEAAIRRELGLD